ncbi:MAG: allantoinase AllB [Stackebrandtia sp.]
MERLPEDHAVTYEAVFRSRRAVLPDGERPAAVAVRDGRIAAVGDYDAPFAAASEEDLAALPLLPGLVDSHVHVNEPGRTEWEGFATATRAAAAGGVTTIVDMPLNSLPPTLDPAALAVKREAARGKVYTDVGFWGGAVPENLGRLAPLRQAGVVGFKCFTADSGVDEFPPLTPEQLRGALEECAAIDATLIVHAEDADVLDAAAPASRSFADFVASRPAEAEVLAVRRVVAAALVADARVHILHLSAAEAAAEVASARAAGVKVTAETCPHYLTLSAEEVPDAATEYKCCPPVRDADNREALWTALSRGVIDSVVSDHSPCTPQLKAGDFAAAWGGISSLQLGLPLVWTHAAPRGHTLRDVCRWMADAPARLIGSRRKGRIAVGRDADLVAFDPDRRWTVRAEELFHRHPITPYEGMTLTGAVEAAWLRGRRVADAPAGRLLSKEDI